MEYALADGRAADPSLESDIGKGAGDGCLHRVHLPGSGLDKPEVLSNFPFLDGPGGGGQPASPGWLFLHRDRHC